MLLLVGSKDDDELCCWTRVPAFCADVVLNTIASLHACCGFVLCGFFVSCTLLNLVTCNAFLLVRWMSPFCFATNFSQPKLLVFGYFAILSETASDIKRRFCSVKFCSFVLIFSLYAICISESKICSKTEERSVQIFISYERSFSLVFWEVECYGSTICTTMARSHGEIEPKYVLRSEISNGIWKSCTVSHSLDSYVIVFRDKVILQ